jgi:hypothetical protein
MDVSPQAEAKPSVRPPSRAGEVPRADASHPPETSKPESAGWLRATLVALATLLAANVTLLLGRHTGRFDAYDYFCPYYTLIADHARQGQLLLWTPLANGGCPAGFEPQVGAFSPLVVFLGLLTGGHEFGFRVYWLTVWGLGGLGVLVLARHLLAPAWMGCLAAVGFVFSAIYTGHAQHTSYLWTMSLFPWVIWRLDVAVTRRSFFPAVQAGAVWGLSGVGGYPGMLVVGGCYAGLWAVGRLVLGRSDAEVRGVVLAAAMVACLAAGLTVLLPTYAGFAVESRGYSDRSEALPREVATGAGALPPGAMATFASPYLPVRNAASPRPLWHTDVALVSVYLSPLLFALAMTACWQSPRDRFRWYLLGLAILCLATAMGDVFPLRGWLYDALPPMRYFRFPAMFRCFYLFTLLILAVMAGRSLEDSRRLGSQGNAWTRLAVVSAILAAAAGISFTAICPLAPVAGSWPTVVLAAAHLILVWGGLALLARKGSRGDAEARRRISRRYLVGLAVADAILTVILSKSTMYANRKAWKALEAESTASLDLTGRGLDRRLRAASTPDMPLDGHLTLKVPVLSDYTPFSSGLHKRLVEHPILAASAVGKDRIWYSSSAAELPWSEDSFDRLAKRTERLGRPCLVISRPPGETGASPEPRPASGALSMADQAADLPPAERVPATVVDYQPNHLRLDVTVPRAGWLLVTDRWAPGWRVTVNGQERPLWIGNLIFRAVEVEPGTNRLEFSYRPFGHPWMLLLSWTTLGAVLGVPAAAAAWRRRRRRQGCSRPSSA